MSELDDKLNSILGNPQMMQQIMSLAQSMNKLAGLMQRGTIDNNQKLLLQALSHYLSGTKLKSWNEPCGRRKWQALPRMWWEHGG